MPTTKLLLQEPYQALTEKEKEAQGKGKKIAKKLNDRETRLYVYLILNRDYKAKIKTEYVICPKDWDFRLQKKKELKGNEAGTTEENEKIRAFNKKLEKLRSDIEGMYGKIREKNPDLPFPEVARMLKEYGKTKEIPYMVTDKTFFEVFDAFLKSLDGVASYRTKQKFETLKRSLMEFGVKFSEASLEKTGKKNDKYKILAFSMIDETFRADFAQYLMKQEPRGRQKTRPEGTQKGLLNDTIGKYIECLKTFLKWAEKNPNSLEPYNKNGAYKEFRISDTGREKKAEDIVTLTLSELRQFYTYDFSKAKDLSTKQQQALERVRDLFCFACFTGQRWSDIERLDKNEIDGDTWKFEAYKTKKDTEIYLTGFASPALDILKKYDYQLPKISLQKFNLQLKKAAEVTGINTPVKVRRYVGNKEILIENPKYAFLGSHAGRRTCVSILLNDYNMNIAHVKEITQHSDLDTLQKYVKSDNEARRKAMSETTRIDELLRKVV